MFKSNVFQRLGTMTRRLCHPYKKRKNKEQVIERRKKREGLVMSGNRRWEISRKGQWAISNVISRILKEKQSLIGSHWRPRSIRVIQVNLLQPDE